MSKMTLFTVLVVLVLCVVGLGFYQGWFVLSSHRASDGGGQIDVNLTVNPDKAKEDARSVEAKARHLTGSTAEDTPHESSEEGAKPKNE
jgi:cell division protein FtsX